MATPMRQLRSRHDGGGGKGPIDFDDDTPDGDKVDGAPTHDDGNPESAAFLQARRGTKRDERGQRGRNHGQNKTRRPHYYTWVIFGAIFSLAALLFGSAPFPDWHWQWWPNQSRTPATVTSTLPDGIRNGRTQKQKHSLNVTDCPGYVLDSFVENQSGFTAQLNLAGRPCDAFGEDILNLTIRVTYETTSRLHVNISDTSARQFSLPPEYFDPPKLTGPSSPEHADLQFHYEASPFAFWVTRRSDPYSEPIFDTRLTSLPPAPIPAFLRAGDDPSLGFDGFPLVFEDRYLQLTSTLPLDANIYGLGEVVASSGFRRDARNGTVQTMWNRDEADPLDENIYGSHSVYLEHRWVPSTATFQSHGVFLSSAAGSDIILATPPSSNQSLIQFRLIGGTLDLYFFSGPDPKSVVEQYGQVVGLPARLPNWGFGLHLCRWGYKSLSETRQQVDAMRAADIPLEVMWNDLELYHDYRDFTADPATFPAEGMRNFIEDLNANGQYYIPIVHGYAALVTNETDVYDPFTRGTELDVFIRNPDESVFIGQVWPGYTVFPDWFSPNVELWWREALRNWSLLGVEFSGLWLDMNEVKSFCDGHCAPTSDHSTRAATIILPGEPGNLVTAYPEGYNATISGPSGNITVNGSLTYGAGIGPVGNKDGDANAPNTKHPLAPSGEPSYAIHNALGDLSAQTIAINATHHGGLTELDSHNLFGHLMSRATHLAVRELHPGKRPFLISRSTFAGSGRWTGHWLGDNWSKWSDLHYSIQGVLQFQLFQIPMVGADACGFIGNTDEELCNRWMQLAAFTPFFRNHNIRGAIPQEPYRWDSVAHASRIAIAVRYALLPYWYTLFANASLYGTPPVRALFFEFPQEPELLPIDRQFMVGSDILVTPVLTPNVSSVLGFLPGRGLVIWRDWYTHTVVSGTRDSETNTVTVDLAAPLGHIPVLVRSGAALLLHSQPAYTTRASATAPYSLLVSLSHDGRAYGTTLIDDGETQLPYDVPSPSRTLTFDVQGGQLAIASHGSFGVVQPLDVLTVLGIDKTPRRVHVNGDVLPAPKWMYNPAVQRLVVSGLSIDLNERATVIWE
ncbi:glycosyl hydrolases family 31-domain-containing protein [Lactarius pseudohatsudake]|nr:glycosyl hydrolases family 31-domain-containing protein [Lactarius pseudohatsudake]